MAHCQSGLATADNQRVDKLGPHGCLLFHRHASRRDSGGNVRWRWPWARLDANQGGLLRDLPGEALRYTSDLCGGHLFVHFLFLFAAWLFVDYPCCGVERLRRPVKRLRAGAQIGFSACCGTAEWGIIDGNVSVSGASVGRIIHGNLCRYPQTTIDKEPT